MGILYPVTSLIVSPSELYVTPSISLARAHTQNSHETTQPYHIAFVNNIIMVSVYLYFMRDSNHKITHSRLTECVIVFASIVSLSHCCFNVNE